MMRLTQTNIKALVTQAELVKIAVGKDVFSPQEGMAHIRGMMAFATIANVPYDDRVHKMVWEDLNTVREMIGYMYIHKEEGQP